MDALHEHQGLENGRPPYELADIFRLYFNDFIKSHKISKHQLKVVSDIICCRTSVFGGHISLCNECGYTEQSYNSCRNRHCPKCQYTTSVNWLCERMNELLPIAYYHTVFSSPHNLNGLILCNKEVLYPIYFRSSSETLHDFGFSKWIGSGDKEHPGGELGFIGILHTWGGSLSFHPHIHYIVSGGGISRDGKRWLDLPYKDSFQFPVKAMSKVFKGKFIYYLKKAYHKGELNFPGELEYLSDFRMFDYFLDDLAFKKWNVYTKRPFAGPRQVLEYLGRYTHRVAISNHRILSVHNGIIRFTYKDYKDESKKKIMNLTAEEFIRRFLLHILPHGFKKIRFFGFLSSGKRTKMIFMVRELLAEKIQKIPPYFQLLLNELLRYFRFIMNLCPSCNKGSLVICEVIAPQFRRIYFDSS